MTNKRGFTIVELLITMFMLAVLVVMVARIGENVSASSRMTGLINNFLADFSQAKLIASAENRYVAITFSPDGLSYIISRQTDITDLTAWSPVKTVKPFSNRVFFSASGVSDFAINSTGEIRPLPIDLTQSPSGTTLKFYMRKGRGASTDAVVYNRTIQILPYGGLKVEKY